VIEGEEKTKKMFVSHALDQPIAQIVRNSAYFLLEVWEQVRWVIVR
jgi:hypothetical protein